MKKIFTLILISVGIMTSYDSVNALSTREISTIQAQNSVDLKVYAGYGLTISFQRTGEKVTQAWIGDPSRITISSNGSLCPKTSDRADCKNVGATVIFLRQLKAINFPNLTKSNDGGTQLIILTLSGEGQKQYQFRVLPATGTPEYTSVVLSPPSPSPPPLQNTPISSVQLPIPTSLNGKQQPVIPLRPGLLSKTHRDNANALVAGLMVAKIEPSSSLWLQAQKAIKLLRSGKSINKASAISGISINQLNQLIKMGQN
ncbi:MAG: hypothetical protein H0X31_00310 [Nostocaceae cyanobacterium]|nr:hypothetical protein [Nostocaceae cyanobacterium]